MVAERKSAQGDSSLADGNTSSSPNETMNADSIRQYATRQQPFPTKSKKKNPSLRINLGGNYCGHDKLIPNFVETPKKHKKRPPPLEKAKDRIVESYFNPLRYKIGRLFYNSAKQRKSGLFYKRRSEAREAITVMVGYVIFHTVNLAYMAVGDIRNGLFVPYDINGIRKVCGKDVKISRVRRALKAFQDHGYIHIQERKWKDAQGQWRYDTPIITVTPELFYDLGIPQSELDPFQKKPETPEERKERQIQKSLLNFRSRAQNKAERQSKKISKQELKKIRENLAKVNLENSIKKAKAGKPLTQAEKDCLALEMPGYNRRSEFMASEAPNSFCKLLSNILTKPPS